MYGFRSHTVAKTGYFQQGFFKITNKEKETDSHSKYIHGKMRTNTSVITFFVMSTVISIHDFAEISSRF